MTNLNVPGQPLTDNYALGDFRDAVYFPGMALLAGENPYDRAAYAAKYPVGNGYPMYSPLLLWTHAPFAILPYESAETLYCVMLLALMACFAAWCLSVTGAGVTAVSVATLTAVVLLGRPGNWNFFLGQLALQVGFPACLALWYSRSRPALAGVSLALTTIKLNYALPVAALMLIRGDRRALLWGVLAAVLLTAPGVIALARIDGVDGLVSTWFATVAQTTANAIEPAMESRKHPFQQPTRVDLVSASLQIIGRPASRVIPALALVLTLGVAGAALRKLRRADDHSARLLSLGVAIPAVMLCCYHQQYDLVALTVVLVALWYGRDRPPWANHPRLHLLALVLTALPFVNYLTAHAVWSMVTEYRGGSVTIGVANTVALAAVLAIHVGMVMMASPGQVDREGGCV